MTAKSEDALVITPERLAAAEAAIMPELLCWLDSLAEEDIAAQIAGNPDAAPELTDEWFENARLVIPLKGRRVA